MNQKKPKVSRRKETIKIRAGIKEIKTLKNKYEKKSLKPKICFFEKIGKFDKPIARLINKKELGTNKENQMKKEATTHTTKK